MIGKSPFSLHLGVLRISGIKLFNKFVSNLLPPSNQTDGCRKCWRAGPSSGER